MNPNNGNNDIDSGDQNESTEDICILNANQLLVSAVVKMTYSSRRNILGNEEGKINEMKQQKLRNPRE